MDSDHVSKKEFVEFIFLRKYPDVSKAYVVNNSVEGEMKHQKTKVRFIHWSQCTTKEIK